MGTRRLRKIWTSLALIGLTLAGYVLLCALGPLPAGTTLAGIPCSGLSRRDLRDFLERELDFSVKTVELIPPENHPSGTMRIPLGSPFGFGIRTDVTRTVAAIGAFYGPLSRARPIPLYITVDEERWTRALSMVCSFFEIPPVDARWEVLPGDRVIVVPDEPGYRMDTEEFRRRLLGELIWQHIPGAVEVPLVRVRAGQTAEKLESAGVDDVIASFSTWYQDNCDRAHNVVLAAKELDGTVVWPGEILSFNGRVGPRVPERGYRKAPVYIGTRLEDDYGGGVCQVSSTLYAALLRAGFEVVERHNHGMPVDYLAMGEDATVVYGLLDLKMKNVLETPVIVKVGAEGGCLTVKVFGRREQLKEVRVETSVERESAGDEPGSKRWVVRTRRVYLFEGRVVRVEDLGTSVYTSRPEEKMSSSS